MRTWLMTVGVVAVAVGCANVRVEQRDGCWVRETVSFPKQMKQEVGPCVRPEPKWSEDRLARLVQECQAEADYRWQNAALAAWSRGQAFEAPPNDEQTRKACMNDALAQAVSENQTLKDRLLQVATERDSLDKRAQESLAHLEASHDRLTDALGKAAVRPAPSAYATASSTADTKQETTSHPPRQTTPAAAPVIAPTTAGPCAPAMNKPAPCAAAKPKVASEEKTLSSAQSPMPR